jgi:hypothetical protein
MPNLIKNIVQQQMQEYEVAIRGAILFFGVETAEQMFNLIKEDMGAGKEYPNPFGVPEDLGSVCGLNLEKVGTPL